MGTHAHMCINTHTHTRTQLHTSTVFCLWNWKCDVTWTMTGVFVKDVAVTSNQWTGASSQGDFPLLRVWLVTPRFSAGWRTVSCQSGIQGVSAEVSSDQKKKKKKINKRPQKCLTFAFISPGTVRIASSGRYILTRVVEKKIIIWCRSIWRSLAWTNPRITVLQTCYSSKLCRAPNEMMIIISTE